MKTDVSSLIMGVEPLDASASTVEAFADTVLACAPTAIASVFLSPVAVHARMRYAYARELENQVLTGRVCPHCGHSVCACCVKLHDGMLALVCIRNGL